MDEKVASEDVGSKFAWLTNDPAFWSIVDIAFIKSPENIQERCLTSSCWLLVCVYLHCNVGAYAGSAPICQLKGMFRVD